MAYPRLRYDVPEVFSRLFSSYLRVVVGGFGWRLVGYGWQVGGYRQLRLIPKVEVRVGRGWVVHNAPIVAPHRLVQGA